MSNDRPPTRQHVPQEATVSNMWKMVAIVDVLKRKGLCTKQGLYDIITESRSKNPLGRIIEMGQRVTKGVTHEQDEG